MPVPTPICDIYEKDLDSLSIETAGVPRPTCVIGQGYGSIDAQQKWSYMDLSWPGIWIEEPLNVNGGFMDDAGLLKELTQNKYDVRQNDTCYKVSGDMGGIRPSPGDYVRLWLEDEPSYRVLQIQDVICKPNGKLQLELGKRIGDLIDAFNKRSDLSDVLLDQYFTESGSAVSLSGQIEIGDNTLGWGTAWEAADFNIPAGVADAANNHRVTMDLSISLPMGTWQSEAELIVDIGGMLMNACFNHYLMGTAITGIDLTPYVNYGSATPGMKVWCRARWGSWYPAGGCTADIYATVRAWRRMILP